MAYIPGVPDMGPSPVSPIAGSSKTPIGAPKGISAIAHSVGKPGAPARRLACLSTAQAWQPIVVAQAC
jgi:hypothetical protein